MNSNVMDEVLDNIRPLLLHGAVSLIKYGTWLFWSLALISMVWTFGMMAMQGDGINTALAEIVRFFVVIGFFCIYCPMDQLLQWLSSNQCGKSVQRP